MEDDANIRDSVKLARALVGVAQARRAVWTARSNLDQRGRQATEGVEEHLKDLESRLVKRFMQAEGIGT